MTNPVSQTSDVVQTQGAVPAAADAAAADEGSINSSTTFGSLSDFRERAPKIYNKFMEGIAQTMIDDMKKSSERVKEAMRKIRED